VPLSSAEESDDAVENAVPVYRWIARNDIIITEGTDLYIGKVIG